MGAGDAMDLPGHLHAPGHLRSGVEHICQHLGAGILPGIRLQGFFNFMSYLVSKRYTSFRMYGARFCAPKSNHIGGKTIYVTNFITLEPIWDHPKVAYITEKTIYPRPI